VTFDSCAFGTGLSCPAGSTLVPSIHWPPLVPLFQKSYWKMPSPSASAAVNRLLAANVLPANALTMSWAGVEAGAASVAVNGLDQALHWTPSFARTHSVSEPAPGV
jgi:hypothetical protein